MTAEDGLPRSVPVAGSPLPLDDNVLRLIRPQYVDGDNIDGAGFLRRPNENDGASVNWLEWYAPPPEAQVNSVRGVARLKYGATAILVSLNVKKTIEYVSSQLNNEVNLAFVHDPLGAEEAFPADPSHSLVIGLPTTDGPEAELVKDLLVDCIKDRFPARVKIS